MLSTCFHAHMPNFDSGQNSWPVWPSGIFVQKLPKFFFFLKNFPFVSLTSLYAVYLFPWKNGDIGFRSKYFTNLTLGHLHTELIRVFFFHFFVLKNFAFFSWTSERAVYMFSCTRTDSWSRSKVLTSLTLSLIHIWRCRRLLTCRSRWSPYH